MYSDIKYELDVVAQFLNELDEILRKVVGLRDVEMCHLPIKIFDDEVWDTCLQIYDEDMNILYRMGELDPY